MRAKSVVLLVVALGCGMIAAVGVSKTMMDQDSGDKPEATVEIYVAVKDLQHAEKISAENVKLEKWPKSRVPEGALFALEQVEGKFTKQNIFTNEPILQAKLSESRESFSTGVPTGYRIFDIVGSAGYIKPGDHVDILGTFKVGGRNAAPESHTVMRNVKVHGINGITTRDSEKSDKGKKVGRGGTVFQLLVKESQLEALTLAQAMGDLQLNLRPFDEADMDETDNGEGFVRWLQESQAADVEEPADPAPGLLTQAMNAFSEPEPEPKNTMVIITDKGQTTYEWSDEDEIPTVVTPKLAEPPAQYSTLPATGNGNVYSGYGGYTPTYPTGTNAEAPAPSGGVPPEDDIPPSSYN